MVLNRDWISKNGLSEGDMRIKSELKTKEGQASLEDELLLNILSCADASTCKILIDECLQFNKTQNKLSALVGKVLCSSSPHLNCSVLSLLPALLKLSRFRFFH